MLLTMAILLRPTSSARFLLKNNEHLRESLMVGVLRVAKAGWLSGVNNLNVYMLGETGKYPTACMFTEGETQLLYNEQKKILGTLELVYDDSEMAKGFIILGPLFAALGENKLRCYWVIRFRPG